MNVTQLKQRQRWSQIIDINIAHGTNQQRLNLLQKIVATGDRLSYLLFLFSDYSCKRSIRQIQL